jgi:hypothetical protein
MKGAMGVPRITGASIVVPTDRRRKALIAFVSLKKRQNVWRIVG